MSSIIATEDRREFAMRLAEIEEKVAPSDTATEAGEVRLKGWGGGGGGVMEILRKCSQFNEGQETVNISLLF